MQPNRLARAICDYAANRRHHPDATLSPQLVAEIIEWADWEWLAADRGELEDVEECGYEDRVATYLVAAFEAPRGVALFDLEQRATIDDVAEFFGLQAETRADSLGIILRRIDREGQTSGCPYDAFRRQEIKQ